MKLETTLPTENVVGVASHDLLAVLEPVLDWYQSDEHPERPPLEIIRDIVADLQSDRAELLAIHAKIRQRRDNWQNVFSDGFLHDNGRAEALGEILEDSPANDSAVATAPQDSD